MSISARLLLHLSFCSSLPQERKNSQSIIPTFLWHITFKYLISHIHNRIECSEHAYARLHAYTQFFFHSKIALSNEWRKIYQFLDYKSGSHTHTQTHLHTKRFFRFESEKQKKHTLYFLTTYDWRIQAPHYFPCMNSNEVCVCVRVCAVLWISICLFPPSCSWSSSSSATATATAHTLNKYRNR